VPIITISRTFGSGGAPVGRELARRFDAEFLDRSIVASVAERSGIPEAEAEGYDEQLPSIWQRVASALASGSPEVSMPPLPAADALTSGAVEERLAHLTRIVIEEAAARGNAVIVGRGAAFIVGRREDAVHVHLHAPLEIRVRNLLTQVEEVPADARPDAASLRELCRTVDARRAHYVKRLFSVNWLDVSHYDLAIDTSSTTIPVAADLVELAVRRRLAAMA
jgi:cytidylate kinase